VGKAREREARWATGIKAKKKKKKNLFELKTQERPPLKQLWEKLSPNWIILKGKVCVCVTSWELLKYEVILRDSQVWDMQYVLGRLD